jgi:hypothetical protein
MNALRRRTPRPLAGSPRRNHSDSDVGRPKNPLAQRRSRYRPACPGAPGPSAAARSPPRTHARPPASRNEASERVTTALETRSDLVMAHALRPNGEHEAWASPVDDGDQRRGRHQRARLHHLTAPFSQPRTRHQLVAVIAPASLRLEPPLALLGKGPGSLGRILRAL